jgi:hypothetical protein
LVPFLLLDLLFLMEMDLLTIPPKF